MEDKKKINQYKTRTIKNDKFNNISMKFNMSLSTDKVIADAFFKLSNILGLTEKDTLRTLIHSYSEIYPKLSLPDVMAEQVEENKKFDIKVYYNQMPSEIQGIIGETKKNKIGAWRIFRRISQKDLAEYLGIFQSQIPLLEKRELKDRPKDDNLVAKLGVFFNCDPTLLK